MTENRYEKHCPCTVSELREFRKLGEIEGTILEEGSKRDTGTKPMDSDSGKKRSSATGRDDGLFRGRADGNRGAAGGNLFAQKPQSIYLFSFAGLAGRVCRCGNYTGTLKGKLQTGLVLNYA